MELVGRHIVLTVARGDHTTWRVSGGAVVRAGGLLTVFYRARAFERGGKMCSQDVRNGVKEQRYILNVSPV